MVYCAAAKPVSHSIQQMFADRGFGEMSETRKRTGGKARSKSKAKAAAVRTPGIVKDMSGAAVYAFQPRNKTANAMETMMSKKNQFDRMSQETAVLQKEGVEALVKSGSIAMKGMEDIFKTCMQVSQTSAEKGAEGFKALLGCRTLNELAETHNKLAQQSFDDFMTTATRLSELAVKLATDAFEPINDQFNRSIRKASDAAAA